MASQSDAHDADQIPSRRNNPTLRLLGKAFQLRGVVGMLVPYASSYEYLAAVCVSKSGKEMKENIVKSAESGVLVSSLLLGSAFSMVGKGIDVGSDESNTLGSFAELLGMTTTFACMVAMLLNIYLQLMASGVSDANMRIWLMANSQYVCACTVSTVVATYLFGIALLLLGLATTSRPITLTIIVVLGFSVMTFLIMGVGSTAGFSAVHSGALADEPVIPPEVEIRITETWQATTMLADRALANGGDTDSMVAFYLRDELATAYKPLGSHPEAAGKRGVYRLAAVKAARVEAAPASPEYSS